MSFGEGSVNLLLRGRCSGIGVDGSEINGKDFLMLLVMLAVCEAGENVEAKLSADRKLAYEL